MNPNDGDQPIRALQNQAFETRSDFLQRVRNKIHRRTVTKQVATYWWNVPKLVLLEMAGLVGQFASALGPRKRS